MDLFEISATEVIYVDSTGGEGYRYWKVYRGAPGDLKLIESNPEVVRYRDGETTIIKLKDGTEMYSPTPFGAKKAASLRCQLVK